MPATRRAPLAYLFERFPSFTQTFCFREVRELDRQAFGPAIFSIRTPADEPPQDYPPEWARRVTYLPEDAPLTAEIKRLHSEKRIPRAMRHLLVDWRGKEDKHRIYAAAWLGPRLRRAGIRHVHVHFAGLAARTAYWLERFYGIDYSFTGHANDIFCPGDYPVSLADLIARAAFVVTVSDYSARHLRERFADHAPKIHRVYNGLDLAAWPATGPSPTSRDILAVGRYIEKKGFADLVAACALLRDRGVAFRCRIVGEGPLETALQDQIRQASLAGQVELAGPRTQAEVRALLAESALFCLPCVDLPDGDRDNLPTVIAEAMACGLPSISTPVAGVPEMVADGETGLLVPPRDPAALADAIAQLLADPPRARLMGEAARRRAEKVFALPIAVAQLKRLFLRHGRARLTVAALRAEPSLAKPWLARRFAP